MDIAAVYISATVVRGALKTIRRTCHPSQKSCRESLFYITSNFLIQRLIPALTKRNDDQLLKSGS